MNGWNSHLKKPDGKLEYEDGSFLKKGQKMGRTFQGRLFAVGFAEVSNHLLGLFSMEMGVTSPKISIESMFFYLHANHKFKPNVGKFCHT